MSIITIYFNLFYNQVAYFIYDDNKLMKMKWKRCEYFNNLMMINTDLSNTFPNTGKDKP